MIDLSTNYLGLNLKNPLIVSSCGLTSHVEKIKKMEQEGAGAVVLKSLFEEQINIETLNASAMGSNYPEAMDYINAYTRSNSVNQYLKLIEDCRHETSFPIIASLNCNNASEWVDFAKNIESAGAHAIELNIHILSSEKKSTSDYLENFYLEIVNSVNRRVNIPVAVKIGPHFTNIVRMADQLYGAGAKGLVLFNRFYEPDIDIDLMQVTAADVFSTPEEIRHTLRWVGIVSDRVPLVHISASTGNHDGHAVIKQLLAGAQTVQICSVLYKKGIEIIPTILSEMKSWMEMKNFKSLTEFRGKLNFRNIPDPDLYERAQFIRYFSNFD
jgi:dihydroorotate dehydrogenase (fumarate)